jgi:hypothetical protein
VLRNAGSATWVFSEAEDFKAALREQGCRRLLVTGPNAFRAGLTRITLYACGFRPSRSACRGSDLARPKDPLTVTPAPRAMAKLQRLHAAAGALVEHTPEIISHPEAARSLEQALMEALVECVGATNAGEDRAAQRHHSLVMRRFRRAVEENPDRVLYIPELAAAIGVSASTLRICARSSWG